MRRRRILILTAICAVAFLVAALTHSIWLTWLGNVLVDDMAPVKADAVLVLAGDPRGERIRKAGDLVRAGYVPKVLVSGPTEWYGVNEAELAIRFAVANGYPSDWFEPPQHPSDVDRRGSGAQSARSWNAAVSAVSFS